MSLSLSSTNLSRGWRFRVAVLVASPCGASGSSHPQRATETGHVKKVVDHAHLHTPGPCQVMLHTPGHAQPHTPGSHQEFRGSRKASHSSSLAAVTRVMSPQEVLVRSWIKCPCHSDPGGYTGQPGGVCRNTLKRCCSAIGSALLLGGVLVATLLLLPLLLLLLLQAAAAAVRILGPEAAGQACRIDEAGSMPPAAWNQRRQLPSCGIGP